MRAAVKSVVKAEIQSHMEKKANSYQESKNIASIAASDSPPNQQLTYAFFNPGLALSLGQGTTAAQRVGDKILCKAARLRYILSWDQDQLNPTGLEEAGSISNLNSGFEVKMFVGRVKSVVTEPLDNLEGFFVIGGVTAKPDGTLFDIMQPVNYNNFDIYYTKAFKIGPGEAQQPWELDPISFDVDPAKGDIPFVSNDTKVAYKGNIDLMKYVPPLKKVLPFVPGTSGMPVDFAMYVWFVLSRLDNIKPANYLEGSTQPTLQIPIKFTYVCEVDFCDA